MKRERGKKEREKDWREREKERKREREREKQDQFCWLLRRLQQGYPHASDLHAIPSKSLEKIAPLSAPFKQTLIIPDSELTILQTDKLNIQQMLKQSPQNYIQCFSSRFRIVESVTPKQSFIFLTSYIKEKTTFPLSLLLESYFTQKLSKL